MMPRRVEAYAKVLGGFPLIVQGVVDRPEAGWAAEAEVTGLRLISTGKPLPHGIEKRMTSKDWEACADALLEECGNY
jgi:hypothetical protein